MNSLSDLSFGNPAVVSSVNFHVKGTFTIDIQAKIRNCDFIVDGDATIVVSNGNVQIRFSDFSSCDDEMWNGLSLTANAGLLFNCSSIRDAEYGIRLYYHNRLAMEHSLFEDNYIGVYAPALPGNSLLTQYIHGCTFQTNLGLKDPGHEGMNSTLDDRGHAGIFVASVGYLPLGTVYGKQTECFGVEPDPDDVLNHFEDLHSGIIAYNTSLDIERTTFKDIMHTAINGNNMANGEVDDCIYADGRKGLYYLKQTGLGTTILSMDNCQNGVQTNGLSQAQIAENKMTTPKTGFILSRGMGGQFFIHDNVMDVGISGVIANDNLNLNAMYLNNLQIGLQDWGYDLGPRVGVATFFGPGNEFRLTESHIEVDAGEDIIHRGTLCWNTFGSTIQDVTVEESSSHQSFLGMSFEQANAGFVHNNVITGVSSTSAARGIDVNNSWGTAYTCNTIDDTGFGLFMDLNCDYSPVVQNYFHEHETGLQYNAGASNGPRQINVGNQWLGTAYTNAAAYNEVNNFLIMASGYDVHDEDMPWFPDPIVQNGDWFYFDNTLDEPEIDCADLGNLTPEHDNSYLLAVIDTSEYPDIDFKIGRQFWAQWHLYGALMEGSVTTTDSDVLNWVDATEEEPIGELYAVFLSAHSLLSGYSTLLASIESNLEDQTILTHRYLAKQEEYVAIIDTLSAGIDDSLAIILTDLNNVVAAGEGLRHVADSVMALEVADLISALSGITCASILDSNLQRVLFIQLNSIHSDKDTLTNSQRGNLYGIADQCALVGGPGVSLARTLLKIYGEEESWSALSGCTMPVQETGLDQLPLNSNDISILPNPVDGHIQIIASEVPIVAYTLFGLDGRVISTASFAPTFSHEFDMPSMASGTYVIRITDSEGIQVVKKVMRK